jgi:hypothetical protein
MTRIRTVADKRRLEEQGIEQCALWAFGPEGQIHPRTHRKSRNGIVR